jgi:hypothetical protein
LLAAADCGMLEEMPESMEFLRAVLGLIGAGCAAMAARALVGVRKGWLKPSRAAGWLIRTVLCLAGVMFRHRVDALEIAVWVLMAAAAGVGWWVAAHPKPQEDLTTRIFPDEK